MKKQNAIYICIIILLLGIPALLFAGSLLNKTDSSISIDKAKLDVLKTKGIATINVKASPMSCDNKNCWSDIYQENLTQTQFRTPKQYCSKNNIPDEQCYNETLKDKSKLICHTNCIEYKNYTATELISKRDAFIKERIDSYADSIIERTSKAQETIDDGGTISAK